MSFQQGLSGLNSSAKQLDVIGNNVANASTIGFKQSQAQFADMYAASLSGSGAVQVGTGVRLSGVTQQFTQGNITNTSNPMDTAISGQGFFRMTDPNGGVSYSRNGQFQVDKDGYIVNSQGHKVSGYMPDATGMIIPSPTPLQVSSADLLPQTSTAVSVGANLDSRSLGTGAGGTVPTAAVFDPDDPTSYNNSTSLTVYDSLGVNHVASLYFQRQPVASTTTAAPALVSGDSQVNLVAGGATGMSVGHTITIPGAGAGGADLTATITAVAGDTVSFTPATSWGAVPATIAVGTVITSNAASENWNTFLSVDGALVPASTTAAAIGTTTSLTLASVPTGLAVGDLISIAGAGPNGGTYTTTIATINTVTGAITWATASANAPAAGATVLFPMTTLSFDALGQLTAPAGPPRGEIESGTFSPTGANSQTLTFNFGQTTQYGGSFGVNSLTQDGYASGRLNGFSTSADGTVLGRYSNGQTRALGQMLLANFTNPQGLQPIGNNGWIETSTSGNALIGTPGSSALGVLQSSAVEDSNVDLTAELVNMITAQRVYQANAQTIKTQDAVLQTLVNLR